MSSEKKYCIYCDSEHAGSNCSNQLMEQGTKYVEQLRSQIDALTAQLKEKHICEDCESIQYQLESENENLKKIIAKELSENDDFGSEFVIKQILQDENQNLKEEITALKDNYTGSEIDRKHFEEENKKLTDQSREKDADIATLMQRLIVGRKFKDQEVSALKDENKKLRKCLIKAREILTIDELFGDKK